MPQDAFVWAADGRVRRMPPPRSILPYSLPTLLLFSMKQILSKLFSAFERPTVLLGIYIQPSSRTTSSLLSHRNNPCIRRPSAPPWHERDRFRAILSHRLPHERAEERLAKVH